MEKTPTNRQDALVYWSMSAHASTTTSGTSSRTPFATHEEMPLEDIAARLGLPLEMLLRRVEAGDLPARRVTDATGTHYFLRPEYLGTVADRAASTPVGEVRGVAITAASTATAHKSNKGGAAEQSGSGSALMDLFMDASSLSQGLDPRELIAGLLERWEKTLEQRIYIEQRQRFEGELNERQSQVRLLESEIQLERVQHASTLADKDRLIAERERVLSERERELGTLRAASARKRRFFRR